MRLMFISTRWLVVSLLVLIATLIAAQESLPKKDSSSAPLFGGIGLSYPLGVALQVGGFNKKGWGAALNCNGTTIPSLNKPFDYDGGKGLTGKVSDNIEPDKIFALGFTAYKLFSFTDEIKLSLEAGPSLIWINQADHFVPVSNPCTVDPLFGYLFCSANYTYVRVDRFGAGGFIRGAFHYKILDNFGFNLGIFSHINAAHSYFGVDLMMTAGLFKKSAQ